MQHYQLTLNIAPKVLATVLDADLSVVVARQNKGSTGPLLAWVAFSPLPSNQVSWEEAYSLYASTTEVVSNDVVMIQALQDGAMSGKVYPFDRHASFGPPTAGAAAGQYAISNTYTHARMMTFGLAQAAVLSGNVQAPSPVTAVSVLQEQTVALTPPDTLLVFLTRADEPGTVLGPASSLQANVAEYPIEAVQQGLTLFYSAETGRFEPRQP